MRTGKPCVVSNAPTFLGGFLGLTRAMTPTLPIIILHPLLRAPFRLAAMGGELPPLRTTRSEYIACVPLLRPSLSLRNTAAMAAGRLSLFSQL